MGAQMDKPVVEKTTETAEGHGLRVGASAMQGWRREMEDQHTVLTSVPQLPGHSLIAVYDGHGGKATAEVAAERMVAYVAKQPEFKQYVRGGPSLTAAGAALLGAALRGAFLELDRDLPRFLAAKVGKEGGGAKGVPPSGSTACLVVVTPKHLVCANVGDSRACYAGAKGVTALSEDHKPSLPAERARIEAADGHVLMDRVDGSLAMSRALGDLELKDASMDQLKQKVSPEPEVVVAERLPTDTVMVVACDGIFDVMSNDAACEHALTLLAEGEADMGLVAEEMLDECLDLDSKDNMSVVVVAFPAAKVGKGQGVAPRRAAREKRRLEEEAQRAAEEAAAEAEPEPEIECSPTPSGGLKRSTSDSLKNALRRLDGGRKPKANPKPERAPVPELTEEQVTELREAFDAEAKGKPGLDKSALGRLLSRLDRPKFGTMLDEAMAAVKKDSADKDGLATFEELRAEWPWLKLTAVEEMELKWAAFGARFDNLSRNLLSSALGAPTPK